MIKKTLIPIFLFIAQLVAAQAVFKNYSAAGFASMIRTPENELIAGGRTYSGNASELWKFDAGGNVIWSQILPFPPNSYIKKISTTNDGNYMLCGYYAQGAGQSNLLFVKFTTHGNVLWTTLPNVPKQFNINNVFQLTDQSFVAVGASGNYGTPNYAVLRFDSTLTNVLSFVEHQVESDTFFTNWQSVEDAYLSPDQASIISICADNTTGSNINSDSYVLKSDINGQLIWKKKIDNGQLDRARAVKLLADNTILVTGITNQDYWTTWDNMFLTKLDGNGEVLWQRFFDSTGIGAPLTGINLLERNNGDILITGNKLGGPKSNILLVLMDANGAEKREQVWPNRLASRVRHPHTTKTQRVAQRAVHQHIAQRIQQCLQGADGFAVHAVWAHAFCHAHKVIEQAPLDAACVLHANHHRRQHAFKHPGRRKVISGPDFFQVNHHSTGTFRAVHHIAACQPLGIAENILTNPGGRQVGQHFFG